MNPVLELGLSILMVAGVMTWWFWDYLVGFTRRQSGEKVEQVLERVQKQIAERKAAREQMLGSKWKTYFARAASVVLTLATAIWVLQGAWFGWLLSGYLLVGIVVTRGLNVSAHPGWVWLTAVDRFWFRCAHAWLWPLHLMADRGED